MIPTAERDLHEARAHVGADEIASDHASIAEAGVSIGIAGSLIEVENLVHVRVVHHFTRGFGRFECIFHSSAQRRIGNQLVIDVQLHTVAPFKHRLAARVSRVAKAAPIRAHVKRRVVRREVAFSRAAAGVQRHKRRQGVIAGRGRKLERNDRADVGRDFGEARHRIASNLHPRLRQSVGSGPSPYRSDQSHRSHLFGYLRH